MMKKRNHAAEEPPAHIPPATPSQRKLEKLRADANRCALMGESASDPAMRDLFRRQAEQLALEALELEQIVKNQEGR
jgi:hypothetical protein